MIEKYEEFSNALKKLPPDLANAFEICINYAHTFAEESSIHTVTKLIRREIFPKCNWKTMCFLHQVIGRVVDIQNGEVTVTDETFVDRCCCQIWSFVTYFSDYTQQFPVHVFDIFLKEIENQLRLYIQSKKEHARPRHHPEFGVSILLRAHGQITSAL